MSQVRSKPLAFGAGAATAATTIYTVPAGETALVKWVQVANTHSAGVTASLFVSFGAGAFKLLRTPSIPAGDSVEIPLWWALQEGDFVQFACSFAGVVNFALFGAELEGVAD